MANNNILIKLQQINKLIGAHRFRDSSRGYNIWLLFCETGDYEFSSLWELNRKVEENKWDSSIERNLGKGKTIPVFNGVGITLLDYVNGIVGFG
ncbi:MAG TPA: hypothetical protein VJB90_02040 [Candidatus Nanoarchaeia archaeon]|nr:hypothetical protein [Candidatus Nanoarchaeia archaeon]